MRKTCKRRETCEKKGCAWDNVKIDCTHIAIWLFSHTIKFYLLSHKKIPLSRAKLPFLQRDGSRCETREICLLKHHKQHEITYTHVSCLACFSCLTDFSQVVCSRAQIEYTCFVRMKILNIVLSMQSYKIYCQKSSVIAPDKRIKIIEILWHIFSEFIYIFLQNLEWQFVHQTGGHSGRGESGWTPFTYFCGRKFESNGIELKFWFWGRSITGVDGISSRNLASSNK